jgi:hypothetical protein
LFQLAVLLRDVTVRIDDFEAVSHGKIPPCYSYKWTVFSPSFVYASKE